MGVRENGRNGPTTEGDAGDLLPHPRSSVVATRNFLLATRDSGYRSTAAAVAEFVDNSIQASAQVVHVHVFKGLDNQYPVEISVSDDGEGMVAEDLSRALLFGGSRRFDDRSSLGRYGMGLPNAALSCARRVEVYSWRSQCQILSTTLDLDEIMNNPNLSLTVSDKSDRPALAMGDKHGTYIHLSRCDRLEHRRPSTVAKKLSQSLGRIYRHFLSQGLEITVNGEHVSYVDPLFLNTEWDYSATVFGEPLTYHLSTDAGTGTVEAVFSELPVEKWCALSPSEKRQLGITNVSNVSVVRAGREVDNGWWFMGKKRRQNYDDWWRCEIRFDPVLDELFGITYTKQQITPSPELQNLLSRDIEPIANALNARVRRRFELANAKGPLADAARIAARCSQSLPPLRGSGRSVSSSYRFDVGEIVGTSAFSLEADGQDLSVIINERHPLYRDILLPLVESTTSGDQRTAKRMGLLLLALARAEAAVGPNSDRSRVERFRHNWSDVAATFLNA